MINQLAKQDPVRLALGACIVIGVVYYLTRKTISDASDAIGEAAKAAGAAVNPLADTNLVYRGVNAVGAAISQDEGWSLGGAIYDLFHADYDPNMPAKTNNLSTAVDPNSRPSILR